MGQPGLSISDPDRQLFEQPQRPGVTWACVPGDRARVSPCQPEREQGYVLQLVVLKCLRVGTTDPLVMECGNVGRPTGNHCLFCGCFKDFLRTYRYWIILIMCLQLTYLNAQGNLTC